MIFAQAYLEGVGTGRHAATGSGLALQAGDEGKEVLKIDAALARETPVPLHPPEDIRQRERVGEVDSQRQGVDQIGHGALRLSSTAHAKHTDDDIAHPGVAIDAGSEYRAEERRHGNAL